MESAAISFGINGPSNFLKKTDPIFISCSRTLSFGHMMAMKKLIILFLIIGTHAFGQVDLKKLDEYYAKAQKEWGVPGMSVAIVKDGKVIFSKGYGVKEQGKTERPDDNTLYAIASNTKAFTGAIMGQLVDEGKIKWDDKVRKYLPYFELSDPWLSSEVTIKDLLSHRVGLGTFSGDLTWYRSNLSGEQIVRRLKYLKPDYDFRAGYGYSNVMFITAGEVIKAVTGKSFSENVKDRFFDPLGMSRSVTSTKDLEAKGNVASPHILADGKHQVMPWENWEHVASTGGILSSVADMSQWLIFQLNNGIWKGDTLLQPTTQNVTWTPHNAFQTNHTNPTRTGHFSGYTLGWFYSDYQGKFRLSHTGGYSGMLSAVTMLPDEKLGVVVLTNGMVPIYNALVNYTLDRFIKAPMRDWSAENLDRFKKSNQNDSRIPDRIKARVTGTKPSVALDAYVGEYFAPSYGTIQVKNENGKLKISFEHTPDLSATLDHWHYDTWKMNWENTQVLAWFTFGTVKFNLDNNAKVTGIEFDVPNDDFFFEELNAKKMK